MYTIQRVTCEFSRCTNAKFAARGGRCTYGQYCVLSELPVEDMATDSQIRYDMLYNNTTQRTFARAAAIVPQYRDARPTSRFCCYQQKKF